MPHTCGRAETHNAADIGGSMDFLSFTFLGFLLAFLAVYYILLSLQTPMHGYGIMQNVTKLTNGRLNLGAGTLYGAISALLEKKFITEYKTEDSKRGPKKKEYIITDLGLEALKAELCRLEELTENGKMILGGNSNEK